MLQVGDGVALFPQLLGGAGDAEVGEGGLVLVQRHGLRVDQAREALGQFLRDAGKRGFRCVRIIHGKGLGSLNRKPVLKIKVRNWLVQKEEVIAFCQARAADGGSGALMVLLKGT